MGAWGTAIFSDDLAADVRVEFKKLIGDGLSTEEATRKVCEEYASSVDDEDERSIFWLALAATQWQMGRLLPELLDRAQGFIESGEDLHKWEKSPRDLPKRRKALDDLKEKLLSPMPAPK